MELILLSMVCRRARILVIHEKAIWIDIQHRETRSVPMTTCTLSSKLTNCYSPRVLRASARGAGLCCWYSFPDMSSQLTPGSKFNTVYERILYFYGVYRPCTCTEAANGMES